MAQDSNLPHSGMGAFVSYLISDEYLLGFRFNPDRTIEKPTFLDIIDDWLVRGDAATACPTYERFLLSIIDIVEWWAVEGRATIAQTPLWPKIYNPADQLDVDSEPVAFGCGDQLDPYHGEPLPSGHRVLQREYYEQHLELHRARKARTS